MVSAVIYQRIVSVPCPMFDAPNSRVIKEICALEGEIVVPEDVPMVVE
jgi:hypothetical protein